MTVINDLGWFILFHKYDREVLAALQPYKSMARQCKCLFSFPALLSKQKLFRISTGCQKDRPEDRQKDRQISDRKTYYYKTHCPICEIINTTNLKTNLSVHMNIYLNTVVRFCFIITLTTWVTHELLLDVPSSKLSVGLNVHIDYISNKFLYGLTRHLP